MSGWDGNGNFIRVYSWVADKAAGLNIIASRMDTDTNNITNNGFGNTVTRDGQGSATADQPMNGFRHTGVGAATAANQYGLVSGIQNNTYDFAIAGGTADAITAAFVPAITEFRDGMQVYVRATAPNTTATPTFAPNGLAAHTITKNGNQALVASDIADSGFEMILRYASSGAHWELLNPATGAGVPGIQWVVAGGTSDAISATYVPPVTDFVDGLILGFRATAANTTTIPTFSPNGLNARRLKRNGEDFLNAGDIPAVFAECLVRYNSSTAHWELLNPATPGALVAATVAGDARNARMSVTSASSTATFTADEVIAETALGGQGFKLPSYSQSVNLATTGAGGMDTGSPPNSGYVSLYAIYNPATATTSILACNATTSTGTIYAGVNMPSGYTASALLSTWPTDGTGKFIVAYQTGRNVFITPVSFSPTSDGSIHSLSIATAVPTNAKTFSGYVTLSQSNATQIAMYVSPSNSATGPGLQQFEWDGAATGGGVLAILNSGFSNMPIITAQTTFVTVGGAPSSTAGNLKISGYTI